MVNNNQANKNANISGNKSSTMKNKAKQEVFSAYSSAKIAVKRISTTKYIWVFLLLIIIIVIIILWGRAVSNINILNNRYRGEIQRKTTDDWRRKRYW